MSCESRNRFDYYLGKVIAQGCGGIADYYDSIDTTDVQISRRLDRIVYRLIRKSERAKMHPRAWNLPRRVISCIVITIAILMVLTLSIAAIGGNLWNAVVDWYEDHFALHLGQTSSPPATLPPAKIPLEREPRFLKQGKKPADLPTGWTEDVLDICQYWVDIDFFCDGRQIGYYTQTVMSLKDDDPPQKVERHREVEVGEFTGDFYFCTNGYRVLRWADIQYSYSITIYYNALTVEEIIDMAENLENIEGPPYTIVEIRKPTGMLRKVRERVIEQTSVSTRVNYLDATTGEQLAFFSQSILHDNAYELDFDLSAYDSVFEVLIGDVIGIAYCYHDDMIDFLYWSDGDYLYCLSNVGLSDSELIEWAECVKPSAIPEQLETVYMPQNLPEDLKETVWAKHNNRIEADYSRGEEIIFSYTQELLGWFRNLDDREHEAKLVSIHHDLGYAMLYSDGSITLMWNNGFYRFILKSKVMTLDELAEVARDIAPPEKIVEARGPSGLSDEIARTVVTQNESAIVTEYHHGKQLIGRFMQTLRWNDSAEYAPGCEMQDVSIGKYPGVLLVYPDGRRTVIWNDGSYRYHFESGCMPTEVILAWAASVTAIEIEKPKPVETVPPSTIEEERKPQKLVGGIKEKMTVKTEDYVTVTYHLGGREVAVFTQDIIDEFTGLGEDTYRNAKSMEFTRFGILLLTSGDGERMLFWTDGQYYYKLQSRELSFDDMLVCAQSMMS